MKTQFSKKRYDFSYYKISYIIIFVFCLLLTNCTPGMFLQFKNMTNEHIVLKYSVCDDLIIGTNCQKTFEGILSIGEIITVGFSWSSLYNRGVKQDDYKNIETFLNIFENIEIEIINSDIKITKEDIDNYNLNYIKKEPANHFFILEIIYL